MLLASILFFNVAGFGQSDPSSTCESHIGNVSTFAAVYFDYDSLNVLGRFQLAVLDPANYSRNQIERLKDYGCIPFAYVNVGEAESYRSDFSLVDTSLLMAPDPDWEERYYVDVCSRSWQRIVVNERIPKILKAGYCGLFLDFSGLLEAYPRMKTCAVKLVREIRDRYPDTEVILDDGLGILPEVGESIDGIAVEGLIGYYNFDSDAYAIRPDSAVEHDAEVLTSDAKKFRLKIFELDYAAAADMKNRDEIILKARKFGFVPYVGTVELDTLFTDTIRRLELPGARGIDR